MPEPTESELLRPYVPRLLVDWLRTSPDDLYREVEGSLAFVDISGFTKLTERLARRGKVGAEEMSDTLNATFASLLAVAYDDGAGLVKWGGDAVLLLFDGPDHAARACRAAHRMRARMREIGRLETSAGRVTLRMSVGVHSGTFHFFLVGDPAHHRELLVSGPAASETAVMEAAAAAGQIGISASTAALLDRRCVGAALGDGFVLRAVPDVAPIGVPPAKDVTGLDLTRVVPSGIREHVLAQPGDAEHRSIAVAFVQFSGTDALLERSGPAALAAALDEVVRNVQDATAAHGVTFFESDINRDGGKIMLTAGAPRSLGHEEDRMLRAARVVIERPGVLPVRIGVNRGPVFSGDFGPAFRRTYSVKGDAINLAARVMGKAQPGEVLATVDVLDRARTMFDLVPLPPFLVKGKSRPVSAARLGPVRAGGADDEIAGEMLGRAAELSLFRDALDQVIGLRRGELIRLVGDPGVGKTRLLHEVRAGATDVTVLATSCDEYESRTPYLPVRRLLRSLLGIGEGTSAEAAQERLVARVAANAPELIPWLALLGIVLGIPIPDSAETAGLEERFRKGRLEEVTAAFLHEALPSPALIVIEDVHFIDDASADLLGSILTDLADRPWLIVTSDRTDEVRLRSEAKPPERVLSLGGLNEEEALELVHLQTEDAPLPPQSAQLLVERSGGNPLFLRELIGIATSTGSVERLPDTVEGLVTADIDRLPPAQRTVLRYAAVLGMTVDEDVLRRLVTSPPLRPGPAAFRPLAGFMAPAGPGRLRFRHALIRAAAYDGLPYRRRRVLHDMVGALLMESLPDPDATPEPLALHFHHAGRAHEAWHFARLAAERARAQYAHAEAADYLGWAVESGRRAQAPPQELAAALEALGDVRFLLGLPQEAAATYRQALRDARGEPLRQAGLLLKEARVEQRLGNFPQSLRRLTRGMTLLKDSAASDALSMRSQLATRYGIGRVSEGRYAQALRWGEDAVALGERSGDPLARADAHNLMQMVTLYSAEPTEVDHGQIALDLYRQVGDLPSQGHTLNNLGLRALLEGRWDEALDKLRGAAEIFRAVGDAASRGNAIYNQADVLIRQGRTDEADPLLREALRIARGVDDEELVALVVRESGKSAARAGRFDESLALLADAIQRLTELGEPSEVVEADAAVAEAYLLNGDWVEALARTEAALERASAIGAATLVPTLLRIRGVALVGAGRWAEAKAAFVEGLLAGSSPGTQHEHAFLLAGQAELARLEQDPAAERLTAESGAMLAGLGVVRPPLPGLPEALVGREADQR